MAAQQWTAEKLADEFVRHQRRTRATAPHSLRAYSHHVRDFLEVSLGDDPVDPSRICASHVVQFISSKTAQYRPRTVKHIATALRLFFRFLRVVGIRDNRLDESVPTVAGWRLDATPRHLSEEQHRQLLSSLANSTPCDLRNQAIIHCLSSLGLRAGEVASLELADIDWYGGIVRVRLRKTGHGTILPLNRSTGRAVAAYLRNGRPRTDDRHLFVLHRGGIGTAVTGSLIARVVREALLRAGVAAPCYGAHLLRHTLATRMVRSGARLDEIADILGHRSLNTTAIYAKVDLPSLREVALPWPGGNHDTSNL